jgi:hypothetical protein
MAFRLYLTPAVLGPIANSRVPKYIFDLKSPGAGFYDYGFQPLFLVAADLTPAQDAAVVANADVFGFPFNLDTNISGGAINSTRDVHEAFLIPLQTVPATYRLLGRYDGSLFRYFQRLRSFLGPNLLIDTAAKLNIQWSTVPVDPYQNAIIQAAQSFGYDTSFIQPTTQVRAVLKNFADQWGTQPLNIGPSFVI